MEIISLAPPPARAIVSLLLLGIALPAAIITIAMLATGRFAPLVWALLLLASIIPVSLIVWSMVAGRQITITRETLKLRSAFYTEEIPRAHLIGKAELISLKLANDLQPILRQNGVGLPGYRAGWFTLRDRSKAFVCLTSDTVVRLRSSDGYQILTSFQSSDEAERLISLLEDRARAER